ncbi:unnamed protein product, partial [Pedinophyceae sp. YPF-701]
MSGFGDAGEDAPHADGIPRPGAAQPEAGQLARELHQCLLRGLTKVERLASLRHEESLDVLDRLECLEKLPSQLFILTELDGRIIYASPSAPIVLGQSAASLRGRPVHSLLLLNDGIELAHRYIHNRQLLGEGSHPDGLTDWPLDVTLPPTSPVDTDVNVHRVELSAQWVPCDASMRQDWDSVGTAPQRGAAKRLGSPWRVCVVISLRFDRIEDAAGQDCVGSPGIIRACRDFPITPVVDPTAPRREEVAKASMYRMRDLPADREGEAAQEAPWVYPRGDPRGEPPQDTLVDQIARAACPGLLLDADGTVLAATQLHPALREDVVGKRLEVVVAESDREAVRGMLGGGTDSSPVFLTLSLCCPGRRRTASGAAEEWQPFECLVFAVPQGARALMATVPAYVFRTDTFLNVRSASASYYHACCFEEQDVVGLPVTAGLLQDDQPVLRTAVTNLMRQAYEQLSSRVSQASADDATVRMSSGGGEWAEDEMPLPDGALPPRAAHASVRLTSAVSYRRRVRGMLVRVDATVVVISPASYHLDIVVFEVPKLDDDTRAFLPTCPDGLEAVACDAGADATRGDDRAEAGGDRDDSDGADAAAVAREGPMHALKRQLETTVQQLEGAMANILEPAAFFVTDAATELRHASVGMKRMWGVGPDKVRSLHELVTGQAAEAGAEVYKVDVKSVRAGLLPYNVLSTCWWSAARDGAAFPVATGVALSVGARGDIRVGAYAREAGDFALGLPWAAPPPYTAGCGVDTVTLTVSKAGSVQRCSGNAAPLLGRKMREVVASLFLDLVHKSDRSRIASAFASVAMAPDPTHVSARLLVRVRRALMLDRRVHGSSSGTGATDSPVGAQPRWATATTARTSSSAGGLTRSSGAGVESAEGSGRSRGFQHQVQKVALVDITAAPGDAGRGAVVIQMSDVTRAVDCLALRAVVEAIEDVCPTPILSLDADGNVVRASANSVAWLGGQAASALLQRVAPEVAGGIRAMDESAKRALASPRSGADLIGPPRGGGGGWRGCRYPLVSPCCEVQRLWLRNADGDRTSPREGLAVIRPCSDAAAGAASSQPHHISAGNIIALRDILKRMPGVSLHSLLAATPAQQGSPTP